MRENPTNRPFRHLKHLLKEKNVDIDSMPVARIPCSAGKALSPQQETALFLKAMENVQPLTSRKTAGIRPSPPLKSGPSSEADDTVLQLKNLIEFGHGYRVADTPEYIEWKGFGVTDELTRQLHRGTFSIQAHIDLHGMTATEARGAIDRFLDKAVRRGFRMVLIVHGRGLSSPVEPVLKSNLIKWLTRGIWRKWVMAYTSARACDGGPGATYVLLRNRPIPKRLRRAHRP